MTAWQEVKQDRQNCVHRQQLHTFNPIAFTIVGNLLDLGWFLPKEKDVALILIFTFGTSKKNWTPLEFPGPPAVLNGCREDR
jgi:hypothetical protein